MRHHVIRAIKGFCIDFADVQEVLVQIGATCQGQKTQTDYLYSLPHAPGLRIKLRVEGDRQKLYVYDKCQSPNLPAVYHEFDINEPKMRSILDVVFKPTAVVEKHREVWNHGTASIHLDTVKNVGKILEVELFPDNDASAQLRSQFYSTCFEPFLTESVAGSNEDLVGSNI